VVLDALGPLLDFISTVVFGWRSALCLACGVAIAVVLAWVRPPHRGTEIWALVAIVALCYLVGLWWEYFAQRHRRSGAG